MLLGDVDIITGVKMKLQMLLQTVFMVHNNASTFPREWNRDGYVEYRPGSSGTNLILTSVHGGCLSPVSIPTRQPGCWSRGEGSCIWNRDCLPKSQTHCPVIVENDACTIQLATSVWEEWQRLTGERPHLIISHLSRGKFDGNRDKGDAAQGHPDVDRAWDDLHNFINKAKSAIKGVGLLVDIHGQAHEEEWVELGYGIKGDFYEADILESELTYIENAIRLSNHSLEDIVRGQYSFGKYLQGYGHKSIPSPMFPSPNGGHYFSGGDLGYVTWTHGSRLGGRFDAILVENPVHLRTPMAIAKYARDFAYALNSFTYENYGHDFS